MNQIYFLFSLATILISFESIAATIFLEQNEASPGALEVNKNQYKIVPDLNQQFSVPIQKSESVSIQLNAGSLQFDGKLRVKASKKHGIKSVESKSFSVTSSSGLLGKGLDCNNLASVQNSSNEISIKISKLDLTQCQDEDAAGFDPDRIGSRNVEGQSGLFKNFFSKSSEEQMGSEFVNEFNSKNKDLILDANHPISVRIQKMMENIVAHSDAPDVKPKTFVINANILNAFALPGGYVYVFRGLLETAKSESEVAGVLGHEWAHVAARHGTKGMSRAIRSIMIESIFTTALSIASTVGKEKKYQEVLKTIQPMVSGMAQIGGVLKLLSKSREAESEADRLGAQYAYLAGYEPWGIADMFKGFKEADGDRRVTSLEKILSSHPDHDTRISRSLDMSNLFLNQRHVHIHNSDEYLSALKEMKRLPIPSIDESKILGEGFIASVQNLIDDNIAKHFSN